MWLNLYEASSNIVNDNDCAFSLKADRLRTWIELIVCVLCWFADTYGLRYTVYLGKMDCLQGEDEEHCVQLETSECEQASEFRCRNGLCIPNDFVDDESNDCLDSSDEDDEYLQVACTKKLFQDPSIECEEHSCGLDSFSCGDGNCVRRSTSQGVQDTLQSCPNRRDVQVKRDQFGHSFGRYSKHCWDSILRLIGFDDDFNVDDQDLAYGTFVSDECPALIHFPSVPIIDGHVRFVYFSNKSNWPTDVSPAYVCFNSTWCSF